MSDETTPTRHHRRVADELQEIPENEFDLVVAPHSIDHSKHPSRLTQILMVVGLPLTFLIAFTLCYTSAMHAPAPHNFPLALAGDDSVTAPIATTIDARATGSFTITRTTDPAQARQWVERRQSAGAILLDGNQVTTVVATGGGAVAARAAEAIGTEIATQLGTTATVVDVAPLTTGDMAGVGTFYLVLISAIGGYLSLGVVKQVSRSAGIVPQLVTSVIASIVVPLVTLAMVTAFVGEFGLTFDPIARALGVTMIATFTVCLMRMLLTRLLGQVAIFGAIVFIMAVNLPSMGGTIPGPMLPPFWQALHSVWFGAGAQESIRSLVYFHGHQFGRWFTQLVIWTGALLVLNIALELLQRRRARGAMPVLERLRRRRDHGTMSVEVAAPQSTAAPSAAAVRSVEPSQPSPAIS